MDFVVKCISKFACNKIHSCYSNNNDNNIYIYITLKIILPVYVSNLSELFISNPSIEILHIMSPVLTRVSYIFNICPKNVIIY